MISRRNFLAGTGLAAGALALPRFARAQVAETPRVERPAGKRLRLAFIGVGGRGRANMKELTGQGDEVVALCDVDAQHLERAAKAFPEARTYRDFRELHGAMDDVDAVVVSTPEHTHAYAMLPALRAGKHVY